MFCLSSLILFVNKKKILKAAGKMAREEGKHDPGSVPEDGFLDNLCTPPAAAEPLGNAHSSR